LELLTEDAAGVGYLLKQRVADGETFCGDVRCVADGGTVLDPEVVTAMVARARRERDAVDRLTPRQAEVLALVAEGRSNAAIARRLVITEKRSRATHLSHLRFAHGPAARRGDLFLPPMAAHVGEIR